MASLTFTPVSTLTSGSFSGDFNWNTTSNWNPSQIPGAGDDVTFATVTAANAYSTIDDISNDTIGNLSVGGFVHLFIGIGNSLTVSNIVANAGDIQVDNGATLTIATGGSAAGRAYDLFHGTMLDPGDVTGPGATFQFTSATLEIGGSFVGSAFDILSTTFADHNVLIFDAPPTSTLPNQIAGLQAGDKIELGTVTFDAASYGGTTLTLTNGGSTVYTLTDVTLAAGTSASAFTFGTDGATGDHFIQFAACFLRGTLIATNAGEVAVENLKVGDLVVTLSGEARPIRWIGRRAYGARFVAGNRALLPILIRQDALDDGVPRRDLYVSPKHALFLDDVLVPAEQLVNGVSIVRCETVATVEYFHIEVDTHDIILAEGAPSETYVDCDNRFMFQNADEFALLYPNCDTPTWAFCAPRVEEGDVLQHLRWRLDERLEVFGCTTTFDPDLHLVVDGVPVLADRVDDTAHVFRLKSPAREVRIVSRSSVPAELDVGFIDIRRLGINVSRVVLSSDNVNIVVGCRDTSLVDGFHASEESHRWTDGDARIPAKFLACFDQDMTIEVHVLDYVLSYRTGQWGAERFAENAATVPVGGTGRRTA
jgi:hypothetical protein